MRNGPPSLQGSLRALKAGLGICVEMPAGSQRSEEIPPKMHLLWTLMGSEREALRRVAHVFTPGPAPSSSSLAGPSLLSTLREAHALSN